MLGAAGLKAPAKRTAFGDVSNTVNGVRSTKDDGAMPLKQAVQVNDKPVPVVTEKKTTTFLRQASRPYSVANLRGLLAGTNGTASADIPPKPVSSEANTLANPRKILTKRTATTIFKEVTLPAIQEPAAKPVDESQSTTTSIPLTKPAPVREAPFTADAIDVSRSQPTPASDASVDDAGKLLVQPSTGSSEVEDSAVLRSDGIYIDDKGNVQVYQEEHSEPERQQPTACLASKPNYTSSFKAQARAVLLPASYASVASSVSHRQLPGRAQPEEYWEEEEDDNYDEEGYVTARSFRSRGENTTGGATTVLFPQFNQKIKSEIEAAKQLVEAERTPEEIEDECFDTSMVAEYGDEIFDYMRDLEVRKCSLACTVPDADAM